MRTTKYPPMYQTNLDAEEIVGVRYMPLFLEHYKKSLQATTDNFDRVLKKFTSDEREKIGMIYDKLRSFGVYPIGLTGNGLIQWGVIVDKRQDRHEWLKCERGTFSKKEIAEMKKKCLATHHHGYSEN